MDSTVPLTDRFIETEAVKLTGGRAEQEVWQAVKAAFAPRESFGYWRYPVFGSVGDTRKEPDILVVDRELGLCVVEVKGIRIANLERIHGHTWVYADFYERHGNPFQQAENQLYQFLGYCNPEPELRNRVQGRVLVALPFISRGEWEGRGLHKLPSSPPVLLKEDLRDPARLLEVVMEAPLVQRGEALEQEAWELLQNVVAGTVLFRKPVRNTPARQRAWVVQQSRELLHRLDLQQESVAKQIPPGPQRIRGIAGSGKTVLICQKAALMHLKHPDWDIAVVFFTQSLYETIRRGLDQWLRRFSGGRVGYNPANPKLRVLHAWGNRERDGFYRELTRRIGTPFKTVGEIPPAEAGSPLENYGWVLRDLLQTLEAQGKEVTPFLDAILVDEGQDLIFDERYKYKGKQPFYWLAYQALRPVRPTQEALLELGQPPAGEEPLRRLIWAYDEAQSLDNLLIPTARELFGEGLSDLVSGQYHGGMRKSEVMHRCYRTPEPILVAAHALGMGLLRPEGMLTGITTKEGWRAIGYEVEGQFLPGREVLLYRPKENTPNPVPDLWGQPVLQFSTYRSRAEEVAALAKGVKQALQEGFAPNHDLLVVLLARPAEWYALARLVGQALNREGVDFFIPAASAVNTLDNQQGDRSRFWLEGAVTISGVARAKGNEAEVVYVAGLDFVAQREAEIEARNQLFVALTRSRGFAHLSGVGEYPFYDEVRRVMASGSSFRFVFRRPKRELVD